MVKQNPIIYACLICIFLFYSGLVKIKERNPFISLIKPELVSELTGKQVFWDDRGFIAVSDTENLFDSTVDSQLIDYITGKITVY